jgi:hypothetical protein
MSNIYQLLAKKRGKMVMYLTAGTDAIHATLIPEFVRGLVRGRASGYPWD